MFENLEEITFSKDEFVYMLFNRINLESGDKVPVSGLELNHLLKLRGREATAFEVNETYQTEKKVLLSHLQKLGADEFQQELRKLPHNKPDTFFSMWSMPFKWFFAFGAIAVVYFLVTTIISVISFLLFY